MHPGLMLCPDTACERFIKRPAPGEVVTCQCGARVAGRPTAAGEPPRPAAAFAVEWRTGDQMARVEAPTLADAVALFDAMTGPRGHT
jgi:hypothetical protein